MTADVELLPLPEWMEHLYQIGSGDILDYAHACVAHVTAAKDAEIKTLQAEMAEWKAIATWEKEQHDQLFKDARALNERAERLAEALRLYMATGVGNSTDFYKQVEAKRAAQAALDPTAAQENDDA